MQEADKNIIKQWGQLLEGLTLQEAASIFPFNIFRPIVFNGSQVPIEGSRIENRINVELEENKIVEVINIG